MDLKLRNIDYKHYIPVVLTALLLFSSLCLTSGSAVILYSCIALISLGYAGYIVRIEKKLVLDIYDLWLLSVFGLLLINGTVSPYKGGFSAQYFLLMSISIVCISFFVKNSQKRIKEFTAHVIEITSIISILYIAVYELPTFISNYSEIANGYIRYRFGSISGINATATASFFGMFSVITFYLVFIEKKYRLSYVYVLQISVTFLSASKKGMLLIVVPILFYFFRVALKNTRNFIIFLGALLIAAIAIFKIPLLYNIMGYRILDVLNELGLAPNAVLPESAIIDRSTIKRIEMMKDAWGMFIQKPLFGWGWNAFAALAGYGYYCHNNYLEILVSMGVFGFVIYYIMPAFLVIKSIKQSNKNKRFLCISLIFSMFFLDISSITIYGHVLVYFIYVFLFALQDTKLPYVKMTKGKVRIMDKKNVKMDHAE